jgi:DNA-directed RNA polymerase subunit delta
MKRVIVDYAKLTNEILTLLVEKFPDGYDDSDIIRFKNAKNETIEAVEVRTADTIFLVKVSTKLSDRIENYDEDEIIADEVVDKINGLKELEIDDEEEEEEDEEENSNSDESEDLDDED